MERSRDSWASAIFFCTINITKSYVNGKILVERNICLWYNYYDILYILGSKRICLRLLKNGQIQNKQQVFRVTKETIRSWGEKIDSLACEIGKFCKGELSEIDE